MCLAARRRSDALNNTHTVRAIRADSHVTAILLISRMCQYTSTGITTLAFWLISWAQDQIIRSSESPAAAAPSPQLQFIQAPSAWGQQLMAPSRMVCSYKRRKYSEIFTS